jgi:hypothetical protein
LFLKNYITSLLPLWVVIAQTTSVTILQVGGIILNPSQVFGLLGCIINIFLLARYYREIINMPTVKSITILIIVFSTLLLFGSVINFITLRKVTDIVDWSKLTYWMTLLPLTALTVRQNSVVSTLRQNAIFAYTVLLTSVVVTNILQIGDTAYGMGVFHLGFFSNESALGILLAMFIPFLLLPKVTKQGDIKSYTIVTLVLMGVGLIFLLLILKRAPIVATFFGVMIVMFFSLKGKGDRKSVIAMALPVVAVTLIITAFAYKNMDLVNDRFKDVSGAAETGELNSLGSGRVLLMQYFLNEFKNRSIIHQLIGADVSGETTHRLSQMRNVPEVGAHNDYLGILLRSGVVGFLLYIFLLLLIGLVLSRELKQKIISIERHVKINAFAMFGMYLLLTFHGMITNVQTMACFSVMLGMGLGAKLQKTTVDKGCISRKYPQNSNNGILQLGKVRQYPNLNKNHI